MSMVQSRARSRRLVTLDEYFLLLSADYRTELIDGVLVVTSTPSRAHFRASAELIRYFQAQLSSATSSSEVFPGNCTVVDPQSVLIPDVALVHRQPLTTPWLEALMPLLVVEILSPGTAHRDRGVKRIKYVAAGISDYWIFDLNRRLITRYLQGADVPTLHADTLAWSLPDGTAATLDVAAFYASVMD
jgi:Uma2 family endonuclease